MATKRNTAQQPKVNGASKKKRPWLLMLYMSVDAPNLERPLDLNLEELRRALDGAPNAARKRVHVVVQVEYPSGVYKRYSLEPKTTTFLTSGLADSHKTLLHDFVEEVTTDPRFAADYRALVLWGHAAGVAESMEVPLPPPLLSLGGRTRVSTAINDFLYKTFHTDRKQGLAISFIDVLLGILNVGGVGSMTPQLKKLTHKLDLVGFDACFMSMVEIAHELKDGVRYVLAPQASIGLQGWHYDLLLDHIIHDPKVTQPAMLGREATQQVGLRASSPESLSLLDTNAIGDVRDKFRDLVFALREAVGDPLAEMNLRHQVLAAFDSALWAGARQFIDVQDLCCQLSSRIPIPKVRDAAVAVIKALKGLVVDQLTTLNLPLGGVSIYCPWVRATTAEVDEGVRNVEVDLLSYLSLEFVRSTWYWLLFLNPSNFVPAERHWIRREVRQVARAAAAEAAWRFGANGREPDPKPGSREPDPKPGGREPDPKPGSRAPDPKPAGRGGEGRGDDYY